jgi:hypothetical protein
VGSNVCHPYADFASTTYTATDRDFPIEDTEMKNREVLAYSRQNKNRTEIREF